MPAYQLCEAGLVRPGNPVPSFVGRPFNGPLSDAGTTSEGLECGAPSRHCAFRAMPSKRRLEVSGVISRRPDARSNDTAGRGLTRIRPESEQARAHGTIGADPPDPLGEARHGHSVDIAGLTPHFTHSVASVLDSRASLKEGANHNNKVGSFPWTTGLLRYGVNLNRIRHLHLCRSPRTSPEPKGRGPIDVGNLIWVVRSHVMAGKSSPNDHR